MFDGLIEHAVSFTQDAYSKVGWLGVIGLMAIESACIPFPSEIIMPLAGWFLIQDKGHPVSYVFLAAAFGALGNLLGSLVTYWIGAKGGRPLLLRYGRYVLITEHDIHLAERWFAKHGDLTVFVSRLLPVVRTFISLPAGVARVNIWKFSLYTFVGAYIFSLGLAYGGYLLGENWERVHEVGSRFDIPIAIVILLLVGWYVWRHLRRGKGPHPDRAAGVAARGPSEPRSRAGCPQEDGEGIKTE